VYFSILFSRSFVVIVYSYLWYLTIGIRALSLAKELWENIFFIFAYFLKKKKRATTFWTIYVVFCTKFAEIGCRYEFLLEKAKSTHFQVFSIDDHAILRIFVAPRVEFSQTNYIDEFLSQFHPISKRKIV
jgi:hypothetical protein